MAKTPMIYHLIFEYKSYKKYMFLVRKIDEMLIKQVEVLNRFFLIKFRNEFY